MCAGSRHERSASLLLKLNSVIETWGNVCLCSVYTVWGGIVLPQRDGPAGIPLLVCSLCSVVCQNCCNTLLLVPGRSKRSFFHPERTWDVLVLCGYHSCLVLGWSPQRVFLCGVWVYFSLQELWARCFVSNRAFTCCPSSLLRLQQIRFNPLLPTTEDLDPQWKWQAWCTALFLCLRAKIRCFLGTWTETILRGFFFLVFFRSSPVQFVFTCL